MQNFINSTYDSECLCELYAQTFAFASAGTHGPKPLWAFTRTARTNYSRQCESCIIPSWMTWANMSDCAGFRVMLGYKETKWQIRQPKMVFVLSLLKKQDSPQRAYFRIYPSYVWKNSKIHGIAPRQIINQTGTWQKQTAYIIMPSWRNSHHSSKNRSQFNNSLVSSVEKESTYLWSLQVSFDGYTYAFRMSKYLSHTS